MKIDKLKLMRDTQYCLLNDIYIRQPTLNDIINYSSKNGYENFSSMTSNLTMKAADIADILWVESQVIYTDIGSDWDFFVQKAYSTGQQIKIYEEINGEIFNSTTQMADKMTEDGLNYYFNTTGHYVFIVDNKQKSDEENNSLEVQGNSFESSDNKEESSSDKKEDKKPIYLLNIAEDGKVDPEGFKVTEPLYLAMVQYLNTIFWDSGVPLFMQELHSKNPNNPIKIGNQTLLKALLKSTYEKRKSSSKRQSAITIESIVSAIICESGCYKDIWDYPIYMVYDLYHRLTKIKDYNETMAALNSGNYDVKKHPINWEKVNWASVITL